MDGAHLISQIYQDKYAYGYGDRCQVITANMLGNYNCQHFGVFIIANILVN